MKNINGQNNTIELEAWELAEHIGETIKIHGSIYKIRKMKSFSIISPMFNFFKKGSETKYGMMLEFN